MLNLRVTIENEKVIIRGLEGASGAVARGASIGMGFVTAGIFDEAYTLLQGGSRSRIKVFTKKKEYYQKGERKGKRKREKMRGATNPLGARPGSYPVPRVTGHLLTHLGFVKPGETKTLNGLTFSAGVLEAVLYDAAEYASVIHDGTHSSTKHGPRPFTTDAVKKYDQGGRIAAVIDKEVQKAINESGLG